MRGSELDTTNSQSIMDDDSLYLGVFFGKEAGQVHVIPLFRGDSRAPSKIFPKGFYAHGKDLDLLSHVFPGVCWSDTSGFVATSTCKDVASTFAVTASITNGNEHKAFIYEVNPQKSAIDVSKTLKKEFDAGKISEASYKGVFDEKEMAIPLKIEKKDIKGAWPIEIDLTEGQRKWVVGEKYISNPHYVAPLSTATKILKAVGHGATAVGFAFDGAHLFSAYQDSQKTGNFETFFDEGARIVGGWAGAVKLGPPCARAGALAGGVVGGAIGSAIAGPVGAVIGEPVGSIVGGVVGGIAGSTVGYLGGGTIAQNVKNTNPLTSLVPVIFSSQLHGTSQPVQTTESKIQQQNPMKTILNNAYQNLHPTDQKLLQLTLAILEGAAAGVNDVVHVLTHPVETICAISSLVYDASIIALSHLINEPQMECHALHVYLMQHQQSYHDAINRMQQIGEHFEKEGIHFLNASALEKTKIISQFTTGVLVQGEVMRAIKAVVMIPRNLELFGTFKEPRKFHNRITNDLPPAPTPWVGLTAAEVLSLPGLNKLIYVITKDKKLIVAKITLEQPVLRKGMEVWKLHHHEIAGLQPVYAAGELTLRNGFIAVLNNYSGHYHPSGLHLSKLVEETLIENGYKNALGRFVFKETSPNTFLENVTHFMIDHSPGKSALLPPMVSRKLQENSLLQLAPNQTPEASPKDYSMSSISTAVFRCAAEFQHEIVEDCDLIDPHTIQSHQLDQEYIYVITEDERLLITKSFVEKESTDPDFRQMGIKKIIGQKHPQLMKQCNGLIRMAGEVAFIDDYCVIDNGSGHTRPFIDANSAYYALRIFEKNGIKNAKFIYYPDSEKKDDKLPENFVKYSESKLIKKPLPKSSAENSNWNPLVSLMPAVLSGQVHGDISKQKQNPAVRKINVPLPSKKLSIDPADTTENACAKIDAYFDDIIRDYPKSTQKLLCEMYYENKNVDASQTSIEQNTQANWTLNHSQDGNVFKMVIDSRLFNCPLNLRLNKIHEIAIHIGQAHQKIEQVGWDAFFRELSAFQKFTEHSAALAEKILYDALPAKVLEHDLSKIHDKGIREAIAADYAARKKTTFDDYVHLQHRNNRDKCTPKDHELFLQNSQVARFIKQDAQPFYQNNLGQVASITSHRKAMEKMAPKPTRALSAHPSRFTSTTTQFNAQSFYAACQNSHEHHLTNVNSSLHKQVESQRQHFARMGMPEQTMGDAGGAGIRVSGTVVSNEEYARKLNPQKRRIFEEWVRSRLPFATAEASGGPKCVVERRSRSQNQARPSAYHLQRHFLDEEIISAPLVASHPVQTKVVSDTVQNPAILATNAVTYQLNATQIIELRQANQTLRERTQFHTANAVSELPSQRHAEILSSSSEVFSLASRVCRYSGNNEVAQVCSSLSGIASGIYSLITARAAIAVAGQLTASAFFGILTGGLSIIGAVFSLFSLFSKNAEEEAYRRFVQMIEAAGKSLGDVHKNVVDELNEFQILLQKEIRFTGMLVAEVLASQSNTHRLNNLVFTELNTLQGLMHQHFENTNAYLHTLKTRILKTAYENLQAYLSEDGVKPSLQQIREDLHRLEFWIMSRLQHPIMNGACYLNATADEALNILSQQSFPLITSPSFFAGRVQLAVNETMPTEFLSLPPMTLYFSSIQLYCNVLEKYPELFSGNLDKGFFDSIQQTLTTYAELIQTIKKNETQIKQSQLSEKEKEILLKPIAEITVYENAVQEMKKMVTEYQKRLRFLRDPEQQLEALTRKFLNGEDAASESQRVLWMRNDDAKKTSPENICYVMACDEFSGPMHRLAFIGKLKERNIKAVKTNINGRNFLQVELGTTTAPKIMSLPAVQTTLFNSMKSALLTVTTNQPQLRY